MYSVAQRCLVFIPATQSCNMRQFPQCMLFPNYRPVKINIYIFFLLLKMFSCACSPFLFLLFTSSCRCITRMFLSPQVSFFLFIVFVVYTMLPFSMREAIIASVLTSGSHTVVLSVCLSTTADDMEPVVWQVRSSNLNMKEQTLNAQ